MKMIFPFTAVRFCSTTLLLLTWLLQPCRALDTSEGEWASVAMEEEWATLVGRLKGDDNRLFRSDVTDYTADLQDGGDCDRVSEAANLLIASDRNITPALEAAVLDYLTLCITNHPDNRATFSYVENIHEMVIDLVSSPDDYLSALASHLIYISTYSNTKNHQAYSLNGAVPALAQVLMDEDSSELQKMWAAGALQNLAASYCETETEDIGTCNWEWSPDNEHIELSEDSRIVSNGIAARLQILDAEGLVETLIDLACRRPSPLDEDYDFISGSTALAGEDEDREEIVTWAAMGAIKNLALEPMAKELLEEALECACFLKASPDPLEEMKADDFIYFMRRSDNPCWIPDDGSDVCIDGNLLDANLSTCEDYIEASEDDCDTGVDEFTGQTAAEVCCGCGGGDLVEMDEIFDNDEGDMYAMDETSYEF